jgi:hypothetical protein
VGVLIKKMSVSDWIDVPDNPRQRDTICHAKKAKKKHLAKYSDTHEVVAAAMIDGEIVCKLDGHTRAHLWETGELRRPKKVSVHCYSCSSLDGARALYSHFDNQDAVEGAKDRVTGACRENSIVLTSQMLRAYKFVVALQCATGLQRKEKENEYRLVKLWKDELIELDSWDLRNCHTSIKALALVLIANKGEKAKEFFTLLDSNAGTKDPVSGYDGVMLLAMHLDACKSDGKTCGWENIKSIFETAYACYHFFLDGRRLKRKVARRVPRSEFCLVEKDINSIALLET